MGKIICSSNTPFDMADWESEEIIKVFAGCNCIMALTSDGRVLQKITDNGCSARTKYWRNIKEIAISASFLGAAIGLLNDGTCMISKRALRWICKAQFENKFRFEIINNTIKSWENVKEVAASDAFFALLEDGTVKYITFDPIFDDYKEVTMWKDVVHIAVGLSNSIFGITKQGNVLFAGAGTKGKYASDCEGSYLKSLCSVSDIIALGSECEAYIALSKAGQVVSDMCLTEKINNGIYKGIKGHFYYNFVLLTDNDELMIACDNCSNKKTVFTKLEGIKVSSYAIGDVDYIEPFIIAVARE